MIISVRRFDNDQSKPAFCRLPLPGDPTRLNADKRGTSRQRGTKMSDPVEYVASELCPAYAPFFGLAGGTLAMVLSGTTDLFGSIATRPFPRKCSWCVVRDSCWCWLRHHQERRRHRWRGHVSSRDCHEGAHPGGDGRYRCHLRPRRRRPHLRLQCVFARIASLARSLTLFSCQQWVSLAPAMLWGGTRSFFLLTPYCAER